MLTKIVGRVVSQDGAVIQSGTVLFQTKKSGIYEQSLRAPGTEIRNILDGMIEDIYLTPGVYTVHVLPDGSLDAPWNFRIALDGTLPEVDLFEQAPIDDIGGYDKTSLIAAIAESVNPVLGGYVEDAQTAQAAAKISETNAGVSATNAGTSAGTATTQATRAKAEADRAQALANDIGAVATMRVDTTVGTRVFISDGTTEKMVSGDTGWRKVIVAPKAGAHSGGEIRWRRSDNTVQLFLVGITLLEGAGFVVVLDAANIPLGFSAVATDRAFYLIGLANSATAAQVVSRYTSSAIAWNHTLSGSTARPTSGGLQGVLEWTTSDPWPTSLPGTPA